MPSLTEQIDRALSDGKLRADAAENIRRILSGEESDFVARVIGELSQANEWEELNDRFYKTLAFGTGGLRGRTIGKIVTPSERGTPTALGRPEFPCVGTNAMNYFNVGRATRGLVIYIQKWRSGQRVEGRAKIVIAHDTRHFSQEFTRLAAETASANGCDAVVFDGPRSTPELSFAVRYLNADAGIVITASHNPPHDNGYKVYFSDGAQVVEPHASGIIAEVNEPNGGTGSVPSIRAKDDTEVVSPSTGVKMDIVGPVCESGDFFAQEREMPGLRAGDLLAVMSAGAYGFVMASNYNSRPRVPEVLIKDGEIHVIKTRETYDDLVKGETIPAFLN